jgi:hypothetical protein
MPQATRLWFAASGRHRRCKIAIAFAVLLLAMFPVWLTSHATAQAIPATLRRFIIMGATPDGGHCAAGRLIVPQGPTVSGTRTWCLLSINECLGLPGRFIRQGEDGNWHCPPQGLIPPSTSTARR